MNYQRNPPTQPVLSNYLLPRGQRFWAEVPESQTAHSESHWNKKSENTTNITEKLPIDSKLYSQEAVSLFHSVDDYENQFLDSPIRRDFYDMKKSPKASRKKGTKFKLEDYDLVDATDEMSEFDSRIDSYEVSRDLGRGLQARTQRFGKQQQILRKKPVREQWRERELGQHTGERSRYHSSGYSKIGNSGGL